MSIIRTSVTIAADLASLMSKSKGQKMRPLFLLVALLSASPATAGWEAYDANGGYVGSAEYLAGENRVGGLYQGKFIDLHFTPDGFSTTLTDTVYFASADCSGSPFLTNPFFEFPHPYSVQARLIAGEYWGVAGPRAPFSAGSRSDSSGCSPITFSPSDAFPLAILAPQPSYAEPIEFRFVEPLQPPSVAGLGGQFLMVVILALGVLGAKRTQTSDDTQVSGKV